MALHQHYSVYIEYILFKYKGIAFSPIHSLKDLNIYSDMHKQNFLN